MSAKDQKLFCRWINELPHRATGNQSVARQYLSRQIESILFSAREDCAYNVYAYARDCISTLEDHAQIYGCQARLSYDDICDMAKNITKSINAKLGR